MLGIENLCLCVKAAACLGTVINDVAKDKSISVSDLVFLPKLYSLVPLVTDLKIADLKKEIEDLSDEEIADLHAVFAENLNLEGHEVIEGLLEQGIATIFQLLKFLSKMKGE